MTAKQYKTDKTIWSPRHNGTTDRPRRAIVIHTDESAYNYATKQIRDSGWTAERLAEYNQEETQPMALRGSYHIGVDAETSVRQINTRGIPWATGNIGNDDGIHICLAGTTAYWSRDQWLENMDLLAHGALIARHEADANGIPVRKIDHNQLLSGSWGVTGHHDWSKAYGGSTNWDPGGYADTEGGFPWDVFMQLMDKAGTPDNGRDEEPGPALTEETKNMNHDLTMIITATDGTEHRVVDLIRYTDGRVFDFHEHRLPLIEKQLDRIESKIDRILKEA